MAWIRSTKWNGRKRREKRLYKTVYIKPRILPGTGETPNNWRANTSNKAEVDIKSKQFWVRGNSLVW